MMKYTFLIPVLFLKNYWCLPSHMSVFFYLYFFCVQVVAGGDVSVVTGHQQEPASSSLSLTGLTSSSIFQDDLGWAHILSFVCPYELIEVKWWAMKYKIWKPCMAKLFKFGMDLSKTGRQAGRKMTDRHVCVLLLFLHFHLLSCLKEHFSLGVSLSF